MEGKNEVGHSWQKKIAGQKYRSRRQHDELVYL